MKHKKAAFVSFRALVYLTTLEFLVLKSSSNCVFLLKLHLTKYIYTHTHKWKETQTTPFWKLNYLSAFFCFVFQLLFWSFLWIMSSSAWGTLNCLGQCCVVGTLQDCLTKWKGVLLMQMRSSCYCFNFMEIFWQYRMQKRLLMNNHIIKWTPESLHLCWTDLI